MAGMLPGVECARRRRFHQGGSLDLQQNNCNGRSRRSSFCLYQSEYIHQPQQPSTTRSSVQQTKVVDGSKLDEVAREARERLDERLRALSISNNKRRGCFWGRSLPQQPMNAGDYEEVWPSSIRGWLASAAAVTEARRPADSVAQNAFHQTSSNSIGLSKASIELLPKETFTSKDKDNGKYNWKRLNGRNVSQQEECPVCLECFQRGQVLIHLPCSHRFHSNCLIPWLSTHCHCPCCRTKISIKASSGLD